MRFLLFTIVLFCCFNSSNACLNVYYGIDIEGHMHMTDRYDYERKLNENFNLQLIETKLLKLQTELEKAPDFKILSDIAVLLMKAGKVEESLELLKALYKANPEEYKLAANLGTAYELSGEVDSAIVYINRGIELNPESHDGSEWVHIKVLEAKLELAIDSTYLKDNDVLNLTENDEGDIEIRDQLWVQVTERFPFTPGPDKIMADLMEELGDCFSNSQSLTYARNFYQIALNYYGGDSTHLDGKIQHMKELLQEHQSIKPNREDHPMEQTHERIKHIRYTDMMDNNNKQNYVIDWRAINTDVDFLLAMVGLERTEADTELPYEGGYTLTREKKVCGPEKQTPFLLWVLLGGAVLVMIGMFFFLRKR